MEFCVRLDTLYEKVEGVNKNEQNYMPMRPRQPIWHSTL